MSEMVERVARAMALSAGLTECTRGDGERVPTYKLYGHVSERSYVEQYWRYYEVLARAAIEAMQPEFRAAYDLGHADAVAGRALLDAAYSYPPTSDAAVLADRPVGKESDQDG